MYKQYQKFHDINQTLFSKFHTSKYAQQQNLYFFKFLKQNLFLQNKAIVQRVSKELHQDCHGKIILNNHCALLQ